MDNIGIVRANWAKRDAILAANSNLSARAVASIRGVRMGAVSTAPAVAVHAIPVITPAPVLPVVPIIIVAPRSPYWRGKRERNIGTLPVWRVGNIVAAVCRVSGVSRGEMLSAWRPRHIAWPRHVAMLIMARSRHDLSLPMIGKIFGNRDHTTVMSAIRRAPERMMNGRSDSARWYRDALKILSAGEGA